jgi:hypothetical protein
MKSDKLVRIKFIRDYVQPTGNRDRVGAIKMVPLHIAQSFCGGDDPFAEYVDNAGQAVAPPNEVETVELGDAPEPMPPSDLDFASMLKSDLVELCRRLGLDTDGKKAELVARLEAHR